MRVLLGVVLGFAAWSVPQTAVAQGAGTVELGALGQYTIFDESLQLDDAILAGGRIGVFLKPTISLEAQGAYGKTDDATGTFRASFFPIHGRLLFHVPLGNRIHFMVGPGYVHHEFRDAPAGDGSEDGVSGLAGFRFGVSDNVAFRVEGIADYVPTPANASSGVDDGWTYGIQAGVSFLLGGRPPKDTDGDGVNDRLDRCPGTRVGDMVDATGCAIPTDRDGDGVLDTADRCPNTPAGMRVDANGCPIDADNDGVADSADRCPNTPSGEQVDAQGCPIATDSDGDGVVDSADRCPNSPRGATVDTEGCVIPQDTDGDGVDDSVDRCPGTPADTQVDAVGCRILFQEQQTTLILEGVNFQTGRASLTQSARAILLTVAQSLIGNSSIRVEVAGHTDITGSRDTNMRLSQSRADAVRNFLIRNGVDDERLVARGYGPDEPVADNATVAGRAENRRVELRRLN
jgi:OOP family OmpA-OmpF porin